MKVFDRNVINFIIVSILCAATFFALNGLTTKKVNAETGNWMNVAKNMSLDLNSAKEQPNGVTTFRLRSRVRNPFNGTYFYHYLSRAIDCNTMKSVNIADGSRESFEPWIGKFTDKTDFSQMGYRWFCKQSYFQI